MQICLDTVTVMTDQQTSCLVSVGGRGLAVLEIGVGLWQRHLRLGPGPPGGQQVCEEASLPWVQLGVHRHIEVHKPLRGPAQSFAGFP